MSREQISYNENHPRIINFRQKYGMPPYTRQKKSQIFTDALGIREMITAETFSDLEEIGIGAMMLPDTARIMEKANNG